MTSPKIDNCSHCGSPSFITTNPAGNKWILKCSKCPAEMQGIREDNPRYVQFDQHDSLIREWNKKWP